MSEKLNVVRAYQAAMMKTTLKDLLVENFTASKFVIGNLIKPTNQTMSMKRMVKEARMVQRSPPPAAVRIEYS